MQTLSVITDDPYKWTLVHNEFAEFIVKHGDTLNMVTMSSTLMGDEEDLNMVTMSSTLMGDEEDLDFNEYTMFKVVDAIQEGGLSRDEAMFIIKKLQDAGIAFKERR